MRVLGHKEVKQFAQSHMKNGDWLQSLPSEVLLYTVVQEPICAKDQRPYVMLSFSFAHTGFSVICTLPSLLYFSSSTFSCTLGGYFQLQSRSLYGY